MCIPSAVFCCVWSLPWSNQEAQRENGESQLTVRLWLVAPLSHLPSLFAELHCFVADGKSKFPHPKPFVKVLPYASFWSLAIFHLQTVGDKLFADWWVAVGLLLCFWCVSWAENMHFMWPVNVKQSQSAGILFPNPHSYTNVSWSCVCLPLFAQFWKEENVVTPRHSTGMRT